MPFYTFENKKTGKEFTEEMPMSEIEKYLAKNKDIRQVFTKLNIVGGVSGVSYKKDNGWNEMMSKVAEAHPRSELAQQYGKKDIKQSKTERVLKKHAARKKGKNPKFID